MSAEHGDCTFPRIHTKAQNGVIQPILTGISNLYSKLFVDIKFNEDQ